MLKCWIQLPMGWIYLSKWQIQLPRQQVKLLKPVITSAHYYIIPLGLFIHWNLLALHDLPMQFLIVVIWYTCQSLLPLLPSVSSFKYCNKLMHLLVVMYLTANVNISSHLELITLYTYCTHCSGTVWYVSCKLKFMQVTHPTFEQDVGQLWTMIVIHVMFV